MTRLVPPGVPSLVQSSWPVSSSPPEKKTLPPTAVMYQMVALSPRSASRVGVCASGMVKESSIEQVETAVMNKERRMVQAPLTWMQETTVRPDQAEESISIYVPEGDGQGTGTDRITPIILRHVA